MTTIVIVCGAGAASTFLARRIKSLADASGLEVVVVPVPETELDSHLDDASIVLVGPHLAERFAEVGALALARAIPTHQLPTSAYGTDGARIALEHVIAELGLEHSLTAPRTESPANA